MAQDPNFISKVIRLAWEDRTTFEEIEERTGLSEAEVIKIMRREMKPSSFRMWRKRVSGRMTKHRKRFRENRASLRRGRVVAEDN
ncbi:MAG: TIGR03643 family protein [Verrucomicrobiota bacterium]